VLFLLSKKLKGGINLAKSTFKKIKYSYYRGCACIDYQWLSANFRLDGGMKVDPLIIIVLDSDQAYLEMITSYIHASSYHSKIQLKTFTLRSALDIYLESSSKYDLLAIQSELFDSLLMSSSMGSCIVQLGERKLNSSGFDTIYLNKYQPLNLLLDRMLSIYSDHYTKALHVSNMTQIISVYSAVGGTGKTTVAANLAKLLAFLDHKVFYLNLEMLPSVSMFPAREDCQHFAQFLYFIQVHAEQLPAKLEGLKNYDPITKVHYFDPFTNLLDMEEMSGSSVETLIQTIASQGDYEYIILDLDHTLHERITSALSLSHQIIWLVLDDLNNIHKSAALLKELKQKFHGASPQWVDKVNFVLNKFTGKMSNDLALNSFQLSGYLPYVPQWKSVNSIEQLMSENAFHGHLLQWFYSVKELSRV
jgi:cellulose biosynthesis protein BcsQ